MKSALTIHRVQIRRCDAYPDQSKEVSRNPVSGRSIKCKMHCNSEVFQSRLCQHDKAEGMELARVEGSPEESFHDVNELQSRCVFSAMRPNSFTNFRTSTLLRTYLYDDSRVNVIIMAFLSVINSALSVGRAP
jgi:hypothetical protein